MIRRAEQSDLATVIERAKLFHAYSPWRTIQFNQDDAEPFARHIIEHGVVLLSDEGMCGGMLTTMYFNKAHVVAIEIVWWAPSEGRELRQAFEAWAIEHGAAAVQFSALGDEHLPAVTRIYRMAGYEPSEAAFLKRF